jgi:polyisoprenoid-binding protein YceI
MRTHAAYSAGASSLETTTWHIDPDRSTVEFHVATFGGIATIKGRFTRYHGTLDLVGTPAVELTIEADSVDTRNGRRDRHLRSPDFFDAARHPYVRFVSDRVVLRGERLAVHGRLHVRGAALPLDVEATLRRVGDELDIEAITAADHRRLGMTWNPLGVIRTPSRLIVKGRLVTRG